MEDVYKKSGETELSRDAVIICMVCQGTELLGKGKKKQQERLGIQLLTFLKGFCKN